MADAIDNALNSATGTVSDAATNAANDAVNQATAAINDKLSQLPLDKDPELLLKQKQAEVLQKKAELEKEYLDKKEQILGMTKEDILLIAITAIPGLPKLPVLDPKILAAYSLAVNIKKAIQDKQKKNSANIEKGKELLKYKIKPRQLAGMQTPQLPNIPDLPNIGDIEIPEIPEIPKLPEIPKVPSIKLPKLPS